MTCILTIDIGLKNLAMCVMKCETKSDISSYSIELWETFNTLASEFDQSICNAVLKNGKVCGKKCSYLSVDGTPGCKPHAGKGSKQIREKKVVDYLLQDIVKIVLNKITEIYNQHRPLFDHIDAVYIELQPKVNAKMKLVSHIIFGKFVELYKDVSTTIRFVRAAQKLKAYTGPSIECTLKGAYAKRKWLGIQYTKWILQYKFNKEQCVIWSQHLDKRHAKQDDMCDTFLMAINALYGIPQTKTKKNGKTIC